MNAHIMKKLKFKPLINKIIHRIIKGNNNLTVFLFTSNTIIDCKPSVLFRLLYQWQSFFQYALDNFKNVPENFIEIPCTTLEGRPAILKHQLILDATPFR